MDGCLRESSMKRQVYGKGNDRPQVVTVVEEFAVIDKEREIEKWDREDLAIEVPKVGRGSLSGKALEVPKPQAEASNPEAELVRDLCPGSSGRELPVSCSWR